MRSAGRAGAILGCPASAGMKEKMSEEILLYFVSRVACYNVSEQPLSFVSDGSSNEPFCRG